MMRNNGIQSNDTCIMSEDVKSAVFTVSTLLCLSFVWWSLNKAAAEGSV